MVSPRFFAAALPLALAAGLAAQNQVSERPVRDSLVTNDSRLAGDPGYDVGSLVSILLRDIGSEFFVFDPDGSFIEFDDGTAMVTGLIRDRDDANGQFAVDFRFSGLVPEGQVPSGSPYKLLNDSLYSDDGGPIDPRDWRYYTGVSGTMYGLGIYSGAILDVIKEGGAMQVGDGAGGLNVFPGVGWWFTYDRRQQPDNGSLPSSGFGDGMLEIGFGGFGCIGIAKSSIRGPYTLPGIPWDKNFIMSDGAGNITSLTFLDCGIFGEYDGGRARLTGLLQDDDDPSNCFAVNFRFSGLVPADQPPPPNSPIKGLLPEGYVENGGPVDTDSFRYYVNVDGIAIGCRGYDGAVLKFTRRFAGYQLGEGANNINVGPGGSAWFDIEVCRQPDSGPPLNFVQGELTHSLNDCVVANGSFEDRPEPSAITTIPTGSDALAPWRIVSAVDVYRDQLNDTDGGCAIDMSDNSPGSIEQDLVTVAGLRYRVRFEMAANIRCSGSPIKTVRFTAAGQSQDYTFDGTGRTEQDIGWRTNEFVFTATGSTTTLRIDEVTPGSSACGAFLDKIRIRPDSVSDAVDLGPSCSTNTTFTATETQIGGASELSVQGAPDAATIVLFSWFATPPVDALGCRFHVDVAALNSMPIGSTDSGGALSASFRIPTYPTLVGLPITMQTLSVNAGGAFLGLGELSNGYRVTIGNDPEVTW